MFFLKKIVSRLLFPLPLSLEVVLIGLLLLWFTRRQRAGKILVTLGTAMLILLGSAPVADLLLQPLEREYPPLLDPATISAKRAEPLRWIVVLAAGYAPDDDVPVTSRFNGSTMARLTEGIRIQRKLPDSRLLLSLEPGAPAADLEQLAEIMGMTTRDFVIHAAGRDTQSEAAYFHNVIGTEPFILVTSASHMPRAMVLFQAQGMAPLPAPTQHHVLTVPAYQYWIPSTISLGKAEVAFYEYLGSAWTRLGR